MTFSKANDITDLQAVDYALSKVISDCFMACASSGSKAFQRFLQRPNKEKIFYVKNDDIQIAMRKVAHLEDDNGKRGGDLPAILYYREQGITADQNQYIQVAGVPRFIGEETIMDIDTAMNITTIPLTLTYSIVFLAWDRATIERMALAWWAYAAPLGRKHSRFTVPYTLDGESFEVGASLNSPREILTSSEQIGEGDMHLWGSRTMVEVNTQAVYGAKVEIPDHIQIAGDWRLIP